MFYVPRLRFLLKLMLRNLARFYVLFSARSAPIFVRVDVKITAIVVLSRSDHCMVQLGF